MQLVFSYQDFIKLENFVQQNNFHSQIDFQLNEWQFRFLTNAEKDVVVNYLFQFDVQNGQVEVFCNGFDENVLTLDILGEIQNYLPDLKFKIV